MSDLTGAAARAVDQPQGDLIAILLEQHERIRELFAHVKGAEGERKQQAFDELRALLAVHETAEEMVLRPVSSKDAGAEVTDARNEEERQASRTLTVLEMMDVSSAEFDREFAEFERAVLDHARREEQDEFPPVRAREDQNTLLAMGRTLRAVERVAPTHPHPSTAGSPAAQWMVGPFASLVDRTLDAIKNAKRGT
jgi:hemerythrin HHE cation binding domain-containing protein